MIFIPDADPDDAGDYKIEISNDSGAATAAFGVKVKATPGKPTGPLDVSDMTKSTCTLKWKPPRDDGGAKIQHYVVEKKEVGKPYWTTVASFCKDPECEVQGLYENREYEFRVSAVNENGQGDFLVTDTSVVAKLPFGKFIMFYTNCL